MSEIDSLVELRHSEEGTPVGICMVIIPDTDLMMYHLPRMWYCSKQWSLIFIYLNKLGFCLLLSNLVPIQLCCVLLFYLEWQVFCPTPLFSNLIQKGAAVVTGMEAFRRGLFYRAVDQAPLGSQVKSDQVAWCQQVVVYLQGKGFNLVLSPKRQLLPVLQLQKAVVMIHSGALSCCLLELARGNEKRNRSMWVTSDRVNGQHNTLCIFCKMPQLYGILYQLNMYMCIDH